MHCKKIAHYFGAQIYSLLKELSSKMSDKLKIPSFTLELLLFIAVSEGKKWKEIYILIYPALN